MKNISNRKEEAINSLLSLMGQGCEEGECELCGLTTIGVKNRKMYSYWIKNRNINLCSCCETMAHRMHPDGFVIATLGDDPFGAFSSELLAEFLVHRLKRRAKNK